MGAGKTTIGRLLAQYWQIDFIDTDQAISKRCGVSIPVIFEYEGEIGFRRREHKELANIALQQKLVVATGGGAVLDPENRQLLQKSGICIYLQVSVKEQFARIKNDKNRPLLQVKNPLQNLQAMAKIRNPLYESLANYSFSTDNTHVNKLVNAIVQAIESPCENINS